MLIKNENDLYQALCKLNPGVAIYTDEFADCTVIDGCSEPLSSLNLPIGFLLNRKRRTIENWFTGVNIFIYKGQL